MECALHYVEKDDIEKIKADLKAQHPDWFFAEIQGASIQSYQEFFCAVGAALQLHTPISNINAYLDWMRDLTWLPESITGYVFIIRQFSLMFLKDLSAKVHLCNLFHEIIFPWWDGEVERCRVGGVKMPFTVYLVEENLADMGIDLPVPPATPAAQET